MSTATIPKSKRSKQPITFTTSAEELDQLENQASAELAAIRGKKTPKPEPLPRCLASQLIPLASIVDSPFQTRQEPSDESIAQLAASLEKDGQRDPIRVRQCGSKYELLTGHRRTRAARAIGWTEIVCVIEEADDARAAFEVFDDNQQREDLNAIERAKGLAVIWEQYQAAGKSMDQMAIDVGIDQSTISNRLRLLVAPEELQQRLISGEISESRLREIARWAKYDGFLPRFQKELNNRCSEGPIENHHWYRALQTAVESVSRRVTKCSWIHSGDPLFDVKMHEAELEIIEVKIDWYKERRAFNVPRWNELQAQAKKALAEKEAKKAKSKSATKSATKPAATATDIHGWPFRQGMDESWNVPLWELIETKILTEKMTKPRRQIVARLLLMFNIENDAWLLENWQKPADEFADACIEFLKDNCSNVHAGSVEYEHLLAIAEFLGAEIRSTWIPSKRLLEACSESDLRDLADGMIDDLDHTLCKGELVALLLSKWQPGFIPGMFEIGK